MPVWAAWFWLMHNWARAMPRTLDAVHTHHVKTAWTVIYLNDADYSVHQTMQNLAIGLVIVGLLSGFAIKFFEADEQ